MIEFVAMLALVAQPAAAPPAELPDSMIREWVESANADLEAGDLEAGAAAYRELPGRTAAGPMRGVVLYNAGVVLAKLGEFDDAAERFREADTAAGGLSLRRNARFNLGRALFDKLTQPPADDDEAVPPSADEQIRGLLQAASAFRSCLDVDPSDQQAARNVERLRLMVEQVREQEQQAQQQRQQAQQAADALDELADQQQQAADDSSQSPPESSDELAEQQQGISGATEDMLEQLAQQVGEEESAEQLQEALEALNNARQQQDAAEDQLDQRSPANAAKNQQSAADELRRAAQELREMAEEPGDEQQGGEQGEEADSEGEPSEQQGVESDESGDPAARALLDKEQRERAEREQRRSRISKPIPVERDW